MKKIVTIRIIEVDAGKSETIETNYVLLDDGLIDDDEGNIQLYDDCNLFLDDLPNISDLTDKRVLDELAHFVAKQRLKDETKEKGKK